MSNDFICDHYKNHRKTLVKLNGYYVLAIDGSDIILPSTKENAEIYGRALGGKQTANIEDRYVMAKLSTLYDCLNKFTLDSKIEKHKFSEKTMALEHIELLKDTYKDKSILLFDRGYYSIRLADKMIKNHQKFLFRLQKDHLKRYSQQLKCGEDKMFNVTYLKDTAKDYKNDPEFMNKILSTTYQLRIAKILVTDNGASTEEILLTNLTSEEFDIESLKEIYHLRWNIETAYNTLKNKMKLEEFSGYRNNLIRQDIYSTVWLSNLISMLIKEMNVKDEIDNAKYKHEMKRNMNEVIGIVKTYIIKSLMYYNSCERLKYHFTDISILRNPIDQRY